MLLKHITMISKDQEEVHTEIIIAMSVLSGITIYTYIVSYSYQIASQVSLLNIYIYI